MWPDWNFRKAPQVARPGKVARDLAGEPSPVVTAYLYVWLSVVSLAGGTGPEMLDGTWLTPTWGAKSSRG